MATITYENLTDRINADALRGAGDYEFPLALDMNKVADLIIVNVTQMINDGSLELDNMFLDGEHAEWLYADQGITADDFFVHNIGKEANPTLQDEDRQALIKALTDGNIQEVGGISKLVGERIEDNLAGAMRFVVSDVLLDLTGYDWMTPQGEKAINEYIYVTGAPA